MISADGFSGRTTTSSDSHVDLGRDLFLAVVEDLQVLVVELQQHGPEPRLPGGFELNVGRSCVPVGEVAIQAQLLELDAKRPDVLNQRLGLGAAGVPGAASIVAPAMMPIVPSPVAKVERHLGEPRDLVEGFEEGLVHRYRDQARGW